MEKWINDFLECLSCVSHEDLRIDEAFLIKHQNLPKSIFKYRAISEYSIDNLNTDTVWMTSADQYNDPYDSSISLDYGSMLDKVPYDFFREKIAGAGVLTDEEIKISEGSQMSFDTIARILLSKEVSIDKSKHDEMVSGLRDAFSYATRSQVDEINDFIQKGMKICSFSTNKSSIIMWGHYSDYHKGICIEYDLSRFDSSAMQLRMLFPVIYSSKLFDSTEYFIESIKNDGPFNNLFGQIAALYKSPEWAYEKEWRLVLPLGPSESPMNCKMVPPKAIYLGARISEEYEKLISNIAKEKGAKLFQTRLSRTEFKLEFDEVTDSYKK